MYVLIMMLFNFKTETFHPIMYFESPLPGNPDNLFRFRSKGHRTVGFKNREEALATIEPELVQRLEGHKIFKDLEGDLPWDGEGIPTDTQLRDKEWINNN